MASEHPTLRVANWPKYQHYKDRTPPWIKLHATLISSRCWVLWDDASRALAIACMVIASRTEGDQGSFLADPEYLKRVAYLNSEPDFNPLISCGFLEVDSGMLASCKQVARPETETETEKKGASAPSAASPPSGVWDVGRSILGGPLLGKTIRDHGEDTTRRAILTTMEKSPGDPKTYLLGVLKNGTAAHDPDATHDEDGNPRHWL